MHGSSGAQKTKFAFGLEFKDAAKLTEVADKLLAAGNKSAPQKLAFAPYEAGVAGGDQVVVFDVPEVGRFGLSICYDIWFPETTRQLVRAAAR